ncbi:MAG: hypothetical protein KBS62_00205 [Oscillospiraceae bacterium]|nr:hypothetical protein [Candidatus Ruminococcus equi]
MNYTIKENEKFKSKEIYFDGKPSEAIRTALKELKFRWHKVKKCWYGFADEIVISDILSNEGENEEFSTGVILSDGYMGATRTDGINENRFDYSSDCFKKAFKACGLKGVTVKKHSYSGGMSFKFTVSLSTDEYKTFKQFQKETKISDIIYYNDISYYSNDLTSYGSRYVDRINFDEWQNLEDEILKKGIEIEALRLAYDNYLKDFSIFHEEHNQKILTEKGLNRLNYIHDIIKSFRYNDSNSMVDYFNTNFYYDIVYKLV